MARNTGERWNITEHSPLAFHKEDKRGHWYHFITVSYVISLFTKRLKTNLLQLFAHPEESEWFSKIFVIIFEVNIVAEQKQA